MMLSRNAVETEGDKLQFLEFTYKHGYLQAKLKIRACGTEFYLNRHAMERRLYDLIEHQEPHEVTDYVLTAWPERSVFVCYNKLEHLNIMAGGGEVDGILRTFDIEMVKERSKDPFWKNVLDNWPSE